MARLRAVFLDVGWTLAYPERSIWEIFADLCAEAGVATTAAACEELIRGLAVAGLEHAEEQFRSGRQYADSDAEFGSMFHNMSAVIFGQLGVDDREGALTQSFLRNFWTKANWRPFPEVEAVLPEIRRRGVRVGVLSNAPTDLPGFLDRLGVSRYLDFAVVSAVEGVKKPDRRIFDIALARAGVAPEEAVHVGDMYLEDIVGGRGAGVNTLLIERGRHALFPSFRESNGKAIDSKSVVRDLHGVLDFVDRSVGGCAAGS